MSDEKPPFQVIQGDRQPKTPGREVKIGQHVLTIPPFTEPQILAHKNDLALINPSAKLVLLWQEPEFDAFAAVLRTAIANNHPDVSIEDLRKHLTAGLVMQVIAALNA